MGKGSTRRVEDPRKFEQGWGQIDWGKKPAEPQPEPPKETHKNS